MEINFLHLLIPSSGIDYSSGKEIKAVKSYR